MASYSHSSHWPAHNVVPLPAHSVAYPWITMPMNAARPPHAPRKPHTVVPIAQTLRLTVPAEPAPPGVPYPFLAAGRSPLKFDLRKDPRKAHRNEFMQHHYYSLFSHPVKQVRLICRDFPWPIEIKDDWIVCGKVWNDVYFALQEDITESEWAMANEKQREKIRRAVRHREAESGNRDMKPRRIDWLGEATVFAGLEKDDAFVSQMTMPGRKETMDTWVIRLSMRR